MDVSVDADTRHDRAYEGTATRSGDATAHG